MSTHSEDPRRLPENADLRHLKDQAKDLLKAGQAESLARRSSRSPGNTAPRAGPSSRPTSNHSSSPGRSSWPSTPTTWRRSAPITRHRELHHAPLGYGKAGPLTWVAECRVPRVPPGETRLAMRGG